MRARTGSSCCSIRIRFSSSVRSSLALLSAASRISANACSFSVRSVSAVSSFSRSSSPSAPSSSDLACSVLSSIRRHSSTDSRAWFLRSSKRVWHSRQENSASCTSRSTLTMASRASRKARLADSLTERRSLNDDWAIATADSRFCNSANCSSRRNCSACCSASCSSRPALSARARSS